MQHANENHAEVLKKREKELQEREMNLLEREINIIIQVCDFFNRESLVASCRHVWNYRMLELSDGCWNCWNLELSDVGNVVRNCHSKHVGNLQHGLLHMADMFGMSCRQLLRLIQS